MSGHSKWSQIKHKKALTDAKKGKIFNKLARQLTVAVKQKSGDPEKNPSLRMFIDKARAFNMPLDNIERAIKRGLGEIEGVKIEEFLIEAYGPGGAALIIEGVTDNKNRTISEIKFILSEHQGKLAESGSVVWLFERRGIIDIGLSENTAGKDEIELLAIEAGVQDIKWMNEEDLELYTRPEELDEIKKYLEDKQIKISGASFGWRPKNEIVAPNDKTTEQAKKLFESLDENDDINEIYSNCR